MEMSGHILAVATLPRGKMSPVPTC